jgi:hypothetical protein
MLKKTLWILALRGGFSNLLFTFYACDASEAEAKASGLEAEHKAPRISLQNFPGGFKVVTSELPGTVDVSEGVK